jgi:high affinity Mn2+ porin
LALALLPALAWSDGEPAAEREAYAVHGQLTYVEQGTSDFMAPYRGTNSLTPNIGEETVDATLYAGLRLWPGAEIWVNVEVDQGRGLDDTLGVAGFPSGEAYKVGKNEPYLRMPRCFVRQTIDLDEDREPISGIANVLAGTQSANRLVLTVGKLSVTDVFDTNRYAHDARVDFLNWSAIDEGTFDYAADAWGYTVGVAAEWYQAAWAVRAGVFDLSDVPNSTHLEPGFHEFQMDFEVEHRHELLGQQGKAALTVFESRGQMALLDDAVTTENGTDVALDLAPLRRYRSRAGAAVNLEQQVLADLGLFLRAGKAGGDVEAYDFTDVDRTMALGASLQGSRWSRGDDTLGVAAVVNDISAARERYLNAGGLGLLVGDGKLPHPGSERLVETYYSLAVLGFAHLSLDYQWIKNPAYNRDRGPVTVFALRVHAQF